MNTKTRETNAVALKSTDFATAIGNAVPRTVMDGNKFLRALMTSINRNPKILECTLSSIKNCALQLAQLGLYPDGRDAHLIPRNNRKKNAMECGVIVDYKGYVTLAYRSNMISNMHADVVREGDEFAYDLGKVTHHTPWFLSRKADKPADPGEVYAVYSHVTFKDGSASSRVLSVEEIEKSRKRSSSPNDGPWATDWEEMAKKTAFRNHQKRLPVSPEIRELVSVEEEHEREIDITPSRPIFDAIEAEEKPELPEQTEPQPESNEPSLGDLMAEAGIGFDAVKDWIRTNAKTIKPEMVDAWETPQDIPEGTSKIIVKNLGRIAEAVKGGAR